ncbi:MAG: hypothetical protein EBE86_016335 [Hormoscilla sp. GUM202]|nr:hypothetical protein [Hormoscilla sp. GUM202]
MAELVFQYDGVVDKFIGDRVMASFGIPISRTTRSQIARDAISAVSCARQMALKLRQLNQQWLILSASILTHRKRLSSTLSNFLYN